MIIETEVENDKAVAELDAMMGIPEDERTIVNHARMSVLIDAITAFEDVHYPMDGPELTL